MHYKTLNFTNFYSIVLFSFAFFTIIHEKKTNISEQVNRCILIRPLNECKAFRLNMPNSRIIAVPKLILVLVAMSERLFSPL